ncbi:MAG: T9SS type A sorting domain-containing protein [Bacteroidales bacterium]|nr:T9SS type A sorting domain-containing protein [Bacteroidales bacterium]
MKKLIILGSLFLCGSVVSAQTLAFPEAEGFGKYTTGGRGGIVLEVTNLNDAGLGSLREAVNNSNTRTIVFRVSGTIYLRSILRIDYGNVTIAGQTAPGDGITLAGYNLRVDADNVIIRYIRARLGDMNKQADDAFTCTEQHNIIIDHCSFSWSLDEAASAYGNKDFTMQWCIVSESLYNSYHPKGNHGYGGIWGGSKASFHHNLLAHHTSRNPRFNGARYYTSWDEIMDHRNNVIYNWGGNSAYGGEPSEYDGNKASINMVKNYYKPGPATRTDAVSYRIVSPDADTAFHTYSNWYIDSNYVVGSANATNDNWAYGVQGISSAIKEQIRSLTPFLFDVTTEHSAEEAYAAVLQHAGASLPRRDTIDSRIIWETENGTALYGGATYGAGKGIIDSQDDVGGFPMLFSAPAPADGDHDGMSDQWELDNGLNPANAADRNGDADGDGYTNLEEYLNGIVAFRDFIRPPTNLLAELSDIRAITLTWDDNASNETGFFVERKDLGSYAVIDTLPGNTLSYTDTALQFETTYTYRVRAFSSTDTSVYSNESATTTLSETGLPLPASQPEPENGKDDVKLLLAILTWKKGVGSTTHNVYFGTTNPPPFVENVTEASYIPAGIEAGTTYFWRVDEQNAYGITEGPVWSFSTRLLMSPQLVGYWKLDQGSPTPDSSGFGNDGNLVNVGLAGYSNDAAVNKALWFNGTNQYVSVPHNRVFDFEEGPFSVSFWMKQNPSEVVDTVEYRYVVKGSHTADAQLGRTGKRYEVYYKPEKTAFRFAVDDNLVKSEVEVSPVNFVTNKWVHVVAIRDTLSGKLRLFANAFLEGETTDNTGDISQDENLFFGYCLDFGSYLRGGLDDVRLYNFVLTSEEIDSLYELGPQESRLFTISGNPDLPVYPNPASERITLILSQLQGEDAEVRIIDMTGNTVLVRKIEKGMIQQPVSINISGLEAGFYGIAVTTNKSLSGFTRLIIVK